MECVCNGAGLDGFDSTGLGARMNFLPDIGILPRREHGCLTPQWGRRLQESDLELFVAVCADPIRKPILCTFQATHSLRRHCLQTPLNHQSPSNSRSWNESGRCLSIYTIDSAAEGNFVHQAYSYSVTRTWVERLRL